MKKTFSIFSTLLFSLLLGLGVVSTNINKSSYQVKAEEAETRYVYIDVRIINEEAGNKLLKKIHAFFSYSHCSVPGIPMTETVKTDIWKVAIPEGETTVAFYTLRGDDSIYAETPGDPMPIRDDNKRMFKVTSKHLGLDYDDPNRLYGEWVTIPDIPDEEGYYVVNSSNDYKYENSVKMEEGVSGDKAQAIQYHGKKDKYIKIRSFFDNTDTTYPSSGDGYKCKSKDYNVYLDKDDDLLVEDYVSPEVEDGYYLFGSFGGTTISEFTSDYKMSPFVDKLYCYIEYIDNVPLKEGDVISVKHYSSSRHPRAINIAPNESAHINYFILDGDEVEIRHDVDADIFIVDDGDTITFMPRWHTEKVFNQVTAVFFDVNGVKTGTQELPDQVAYGPFDPQPIDIEGKYCLGNIYTDEDCTIPVTSYGPQHVYIKYYNPGYYCLVDSDDKTIYNAGVKMDTTNIEEDSVAEVTVHPIADGERIYAILYFQADGKIIDHELGGSYWYATRDYFDEYDAVFFREFDYSKYYRIALKNDGKFYIKEAGGEFCSSFINDVSNICDSTGMNTDIETLKEEWLEQKASFEEVEYKQEIINTGFQYFEDPQNIFEEMMSKYYYIIHKYGTEKFENFIFPDMNDIEPHNIFPDITFRGQNNTNAIIITIAIISTIAISITIICVSKKKKINKK